jgi:outer membrane biosynthesis protein TonB
MVPEDAMDVEQEGSKAILWLIPIIAVIYLLWVLYIKLGNAPAWATRIGIQQWVYFGAILMIILIIILVMFMMIYVPARRPSVEETTKEMKIEEEETEVTTVKTRKRKEAPAEVTVEAVEAPEKKEVQARVEVEEPVKAEVIEQPEPPKIIEYPIEVSGGVYGDTFIPVGDGMILKLRTLIIDSHYLA